MARLTTVLLITSVREELESLNRLGFRPSRDVDGHVCYIRDLHSEHAGDKVRLVHYNTGQSGNAAASAVAAGAINAWKPSYVILLGVSAGIERNRIGIGDLLIADEVRYYPSGKRNVEGFDVRDKARTSDFYLVEAMKAYHETSWRARVRDFEAITARLGRTPEVHIGLVLSGEEVVNSPESVESLLSRYSGAIGIEMESFGVYQAAWRSRTPVVVAKGVSDHASGKKGDDYKIYASDVASAFVISFLETIDLGPAPRAYEAISSHQRKTESVSATDTGNKVQDIVDNTLRDHLLTGWTTSLATILDLFQEQVKIVVTSARGAASRRLDSTFSEKGDMLSDNLIAIDSVVREALFTLLGASFAEGEVSKCRAVLRAVRDGLETVKLYEREEYFANWIANLRAFYMDQLQPYLASKQVPSYDENHFRFVKEFSDTLAAVTETSVAVSDGEPENLLSFDLALKFLSYMIDGGLSRGREFYDSEDDYTEPSPFSVVVEPLMRAIVRCLCTSSPNASPRANRYLSYAFSSVCKLAFRVLTVYRDSKSLENVIRSGILQLLSDRHTVDTYEFSVVWRSLFDYDSPAGFDDIISVVVDNLKKHRGLFEEHSMLKLFRNTLEGYRTQMRVYPRVGQWLRGVLVECIVQMKPERAPAPREVTRQLLSIDEKHLNYTDVADALLLIGEMLVVGLVTKEEVVHEMQELWRTHGRWRVKVTEYLEEKAKKEQSESFLTVRAEDWEKNAAEEILKTIQ